MVGGVAAALRGLGGYSAVFLVAGLIYFIGVFAVHVLSPNLTPAKFPHDASIPEKLPFNWGAAGLGAIWMLFHGKVVLGIILIFVNVGLGIISKLSIPGTIFAIVGSVLVVLFCGAAGGEFAWKHHKATSIAELKKKEFGWNMAGVIILGLVAAYAAFLLGTLLSKILF
jgi:hypothetical protein